MEGKKSEQICDDEFDLLLGEIPNATSENPHRDTSSRLGTNSMDVSSYSSPSRNFANLYSSSQSVKCEGEMGFLRNSTFSGPQIAQTHQSNQNEACTLNGRKQEHNSLTLAFEELCVKEKVMPRITTTSLYEHDHNSPCISFMNSSQVYVPQAYHSVHDYGDFPEYPGNELKRRKPEILPSDLTDQRQNLSSHNRAVPLNPYLLLPPYQKQFFLDAEVPTLLPARHHSRLNMPWQNVEEEMLLRLHQQYICQQQFGNNRSDFSNFRNNVNFVNNPVSGYQGPQHTEFLRNPRSFWNERVIHGACNGYLPQSSCAHVVDEVENYYFPENILTKSHGMSSRRSIRSNSVLNNSSSLFSNSHAHLLMSNGSFKSYGQDSRNLLLNSSDYLHASKSSIQVQYNSVDEVIGRIHSLAKDQHGCRFLQRKFTEANPEDIEKIFREIIGHIIDLMTDPFGNYLIQKLLDVCNEDQKMQIVRAITVEASIFIRISCNMHGTRAVQKVIEVLKKPEQIFMVATCLKPGIVILMKDVNGNHVAQRCLQYFSPKQSEFLFDAAISQCVEIATNRQGCCVIQKCILHSYGDQRNGLISEITKHSFTLSENPYGNYVVQFVLDLKIPWATTSVLNQLEGKFGYLSTQKHSSNVVEKCLKLAEEDDLVNIIQELINYPKFVEVLQDPYGNYVIQSALKQCKGFLYTALVEAIKPHALLLQSNSYGRKILSSTRFRK